MRVEVLKETGIDEALFGLGLSYGLTSGKDLKTIDYNTFERLLFTVSPKLAHLGGGHNKFLRQISVWLDITAPMYWWKEFDTYKVATTAQSESTMHTLVKNKITQECFAHPIPEFLLVELNTLRLLPEKFGELINLLPQGWLQRRIVSCNYAVLQNIVQQRTGHKLPEWKLFIDTVVQQAKYSGFLQPHQTKEK